MARPKVTTESFIAKAQAVHGLGKYDYSQVVYTRAKDKLAINCLVHGGFMQSPDNHLRGFGCAKCGFIVSSAKNRSTALLFIAKATAAHSDKYDYRLVEYKNSQTKVKIICPKHGVFEQNPDGHVAGQGCYKCIRNQWEQNSFIAKCQELWPLLDFSQTVYTDLSSKVVFTCSIHGTTANFADGLLFAGRGCAACGKARQPGWSRPAWVHAQHGRIANLYLVRMSKGEEVFFKAGISYTSLATRFKKVPYNIQVLALYSANDAGAVYDLEKIVKRQCKSVRYMPSQHFPGKHECYSESQQILTCLPAATRVFAEPVPIRSV